MRETINNALLNDFYNNPTIKEALQMMEERVQSGEKTSFMGAHDILELYYKN